MDRVTLFGEIKVSTVASSSIIILRAMEFTNGVMAESTKGLGKITRWKARVSLPGLMEESMLEVT